MPDRITKELSDHHSDGEDHARVSADSDLKSANIGTHSANIGGRKVRINCHQPSDVQAHAEQWCEQTTL